MVAREDAEAARVDRHRVVQPEFGAEVRYRAAIQLGIVPGEPGIAMVGLMLHALHDVVVATQKVAVAGARRDAGGLDLAQELERIMPRAMPEGHVDGLEERACFAAPAPPEVHSNGCQPFNASRKVGNASLLG